ncbi:hypothetical protein TRIUR3_16317 [Triticum urartu]|uniref:Uncharacterized protein n=1 Tax=Triticum urartu TaxID=4572 RepID=M7ZE71_TRIUA|nr:hypothetical protein TRIUR3_16317 [Triticum urartu]
MDLVGVQFQNPMPSHGLQNPTDRMMLPEEVLAQHADGTGENEGAPLNLVRTRLGGADGDEETSDATEEADMKKTR